MSYLTRTKRAAPATPAAGKATQYVDTTGQTHEIIDTGVDNVLTQAARFNWLRNSGFWFAQRQAPGTLTTYGGSTSRAPTADGWGIVSETASMQYQRISTQAAPEIGLQSTYYGNFSKITAAGKLQISQMVETNDCENIRGRTVRFQFWAKAMVAASLNFRVGLVYETNSVNPSINGTAIISSFNGTGTDPTFNAGPPNLAYQAPKAGVTGDNCTINGNAADFTVTSVWQRYGLCFDIPTTAVNVMVVIWSNAQLAATNGISISQASLTDGFEIQAWSPRDQNTELLRCQRYFSKSFGVDQQPQQNFGILGALLRGHVSVAGATAGQPIGLSFPVEMWTNPTLTFYNPSAANAFARNTTAGTDATATGISGTGSRGTTVTFTGIAAWTVAQAVAVNWQADAELF